MSKSRFVGKEGLVGWVFVGVQIVLLALLVFGRRGDVWPVPTWLRLIAQVLFIGGLLVVVAGSVGLGSQLTPTPEPKANGALRMNGLQAWVRHPIYSGVLLLATGMALRSSSPTSAIVWVLLVVFFNVKAHWEEGRLKERFSDYETYAQRVPRFVPRLRRANHTKAGS